MSTNPLLDFSGLPRFAEIQPEHVTPAVDQLLRENRALIERLASADRQPPTWESFVAPLDDANERLSRAWGQVGASERGDEQLRSCARSTTPTLPKITQYYAELVAGRASVRQVQGACAQSPGFAALAARAEEDRRERAARLPPGRRRAAAGAESRVQAGARAARPAVLALQRQPARCDQRVLRMYVTDRSRAARASRRTCWRPRAAAARSGRQGGLEVHAAHAVLPAGHAVRGQPRAARAHVPRLRDARRGVRQAGVGQHAAHRADPEAAPASWRSCWASRASPSSRSSRRWRESPAQVLAFLGDLAARAKPFAERDFDELARFARERLGLDELAGVGHRVGLGEAARRALRLLRAGGEAVLPGDARCCPACSGWSRRCTACASRPRQAPTWHPDVRFFDIRDRDRGAATDRAVLPRPVRAPVQARRRVDGRCHHAQAHDAAGMQTPVAYLNCNFSRAGRRAGRRCSRTTKSSRCSTNSATACTTC